MNTLTKDQIRQLTPEQQEAIGTLEVRRIKKRQQLLQHARGYGGKQLVPVATLSILFVLGVGLMYYFQAPRWTWAALFVIFWWTLIQWQVNSINRRLNSLIELLESDKKTEDDDAA